MIIKFRRGIMGKKKTSYNLEENLVNKLKATASLKGTSQVELLEEYIKNGLEKDKGIFKQMIE
jgi:hypothetical protein